MGLVGSGVVGPGAAQFYDVVLQSGHTYSVGVEPLDPSVDFDLHVFDENGNLITEDISTAADAYCAITPRWTGPFRLVVDAARGMSGYRIVVME
jgi:hypothetical protein